MAALVLGEFSVKSGWFNSEVMLYMAFVAVANYTQNSLELGYALKFMRIINLVLTAIFGVWGYVGGIVILAVSLLFNRTVSSRSYLYPTGAVSWKTARASAVSDNKAAGGKKIGLARGDGYRMKTVIAIDSF